MFFALKKRYVWLRYPIAEAKKGSQVGLKRVTDKMKPDRIYELQ